MPAKRASASIEGKAPAALLLEGATRAPLVAARRFVEKVTGMYNEIKESKDAGQTSVSEH
jgi:hypothetical protein